ncbi:MAG: hypothetical protein R3292_01490 [Alcanivorax sp.]|nr:hypothetical protein [Alcanivorax sp.]
MNMNNNHRPADFHGAAVIDEQGREIPITEAMIQHACERLEQAWHYPTYSRKKAG